MRNYFPAMERVEQRLAIPPTPGNPTEPVSKDHRQKLLGVAEKLEAPELDYDDRLELSTVIRVLLDGGTTLLMVEATEYLLAQVPQ